MRDGADEIEIAQANTPLDEIAQANTLLDESRHRIFNCLQMLSTLVRMRRQAGGCAESRAQLSWVVDTVTTMARLQRSLDRAGYIGLPSHLSQAMTLWCQVGEAQGIEVHLDLDAHVVVPQRLVTPLALIVQELVTNSFEHAFPDGRGGLISAGLNHHGDDGAAITVQDDGVGFGPRREARDEERSSGLGIVRRLAEIEGMDASVSPGLWGGTLARIHFACPS